jgi:hypothetical protein
MVISDVAKGQGAKGAMMEARVVWFLGTWGERKRAKNRPHDLTKFIQVGSSKIHCHFVQETPLLWDKYNSPLSVRQTIFSELAQSIIRLTQSISIARNIPLISKCPCRRNSAVPVTAV